MGLFSSNTACSIFKPISSHTTLSSLLPEIFWTEAHILDFLNQQADGSPPLFFFQYFSNFYILDLHNLVSHI